MKKLSIAKIKKELNTYDVDVTTKELVINNLLLYNDLIQKYENGEVKNTYLIYQLNAQIFKMLMSLKTNRDKTSNPVDEDDPFMKMVNELQNSKLEKRG